MTYDVSVMAFKHEHHLEHLQDTLRLFGYRDLGQKSRVRGELELEREMQNWDLGNNRVLKAITPSAGWTVVLDPEKVMACHDKSCEEFSKKYSSVVMGMICDEVNKTYGFTVYRHGEKIREFLTVDGSVKANSGKKLSVEVGLDLADKAMLDDEIYDIFLGVTGVDLYTLMDEGEFSINELEKDEGAATAHRSLLEKLSPARLFD